MSPGLYFLKCSANAFDAPEKEDTNGDAMAKPKQTMIGAGGGMQANKGQSESSIIRMYGVLFAS